MKALTLSVPRETSAQKEMLAALYAFIAETAGGATTWNAMGFWRPTDGLKQPIGEEVNVIHITGLTGLQVGKILHEFRTRAREAGEKAIWFELRDDYAVVEALTEAKDAAV